MQINYYQKITIDLPNFPVQVIKDWLLPIVKKYKCWPPTEEILGSALMYGSIDYWKSIIWEKQLLKFNQIILSPSYQAMIKEMVFNFKEGKASLKKSTNRIKRIINYISQENHLPKPIVLILKDKKFDIADGNHRLTACTILLEKNIFNKIDLEVWVGSTKFPIGGFYWSKNS